ncbi:MAG: hypothetical protein AVDCRST_MAG30-4306, partial [uncultured Solirubrobacteraceae bacterium]
EAMAPAPDHDPLGLYVAQRHFKRTMRGYDPEEVDAHLEKVRTWFTRSGLAKEAREQERHLADWERDLRAREDALAEREAADGAAVERELREARLEAEGIV